MSWLSVFLDKVAAWFVEYFSKTFKHDVTKPVECIQRLIGWITQGTLDDEFKRNPLGVVSCVLAVASYIAAQFDKDDSPDVIGANIGDGGIAVVVLAEKLGIEVPKGGFISSWVLKMIIKKLMELLQELSDKYLDDAE